LADQKNDPIMEQKLANLLTEAIEPVLKKVIHSALQEFLSGNKDPSQESREILSVTEASKFLQVPVSTIYYYTSKNILPFSKRGKRLRFTKSSLMQWIQEGHHKTISERQQDTKKYISRER
jgi:excisionase family DNA binding protein